jgi:hypothetical protein
MANLYYERLEHASLTTNMPLRGAHHCSSTFQVVGHTRRSGCSGDLIHGRRFAVVVAPEKEAETFPSSFVS